VIEGRAAELETGVLMADAEGHVGLLDRHLEFAEETREVRVGLVVEDHETGVDRQRASGAGLGDGHGVGVSADVGVLLEERDVEVAVQEMGAAETGDPGANDGEGGHLRIGREGMSDGGFLVRAR